MTEVLVLLEPGPSEAAVRRVGAAMATALGGRLREGELPPYDAGCSARALTAVNAPSVDVAVLPYAPGRCARVVDDIIAVTQTPVVIVPVGAGAVAPSRLSRVLVPLDGTVASARTVAEAVTMLGKAGLDLVVLHVFDSTTLPRMWDQAAHARRSWSEEFLARYCDLPDTRIELRSGLPGEQVLDVAAEEHADLIALGWSQHVSPGRARTVRAALASTRIPLLLLPVAEQGDDAEVGSVRPVAEL